MGEIVGTDIARHAQPVSLRNGQLVVAVDHPVCCRNCRGITNR